MEPSSRHPAQPLEGRPSPSPRNSEASYSAPPGALPATASPKVPPSDRPPGGSPGSKPPKQKKRIDYGDGTHDMPDLMQLQLRRRPMALLDFSADGGESSDEEYVPSDDDEADDADADELDAPPTRSPAAQKETPAEPQAAAEAPSHKTDEDGIGKRTRAKLSLADIDMDKLEAFLELPPSPLEPGSPQSDQDDDEDRRLYNDFLNSLKAPAPDQPNTGTHTPNAADDEEDDVDWVYADDVPEPFEEYRNDRGVQVSTTEVSMLVSAAKGEEPAPANLGGRKRKLASMQPPLASPSLPVLLPLAPAPTYVSRAPLVEVTAQQRDRVLDQMTQHVELLIQTHLESRKKPYVDQSREPLYNTLEMLEELRRQRDQTQILLEESLTAYRRRQSILQRRQATDELAPVAREPEPRSAFDIPALALVSGLQASLFDLLSPALHPAAISSAMTAWSARAPAAHQLPSVPANTQGSLASTSGPAASEVPPNRAAVASAPQLPSNGPAKPAAVECAMTTAMDALRKAHGLPPANKGAQRPRPPEPVLFVFKNVVPPVESDRPLLKKPQPPLPQVFKPKPFKPVPYKPSSKPAPPPATKASSATSSASASSAAAVTLPALVPNKPHPAAPAALPKPPPPSPLASKPATASSAALPRPSAAAPANNTSSASTSSVSPASPSSAKPSPAAAPTASAAAPVPSVTASATLASSANPSDVFPIPLTSKVQTTWLPSEDKLLLSGVQRFTTKHGISWNSIKDTLLPNKTTAQLTKRYQRLTAPPKSRLRLHPALLEDGARLAEPADWQFEEDELTSCDPPLAEMDYLPVHELPPLPLPASSELSALPPLTSSRFPPPPASAIMPSESSVFSVGGILGAETSRDFMDSLLDANRSNPPLLLNDFPPASLSQQAFASPMASLPASNDISSQVFVEADNVIVKDGRAVAFSRSEDRAILLHAQKHGSQAWDLLVPALPSKTLPEIQERYARLLELAAGGGARATDTVRC